MAINKRPSSWLAHSTRTSPQHPHKHPPALQVVEAQQASGVGCHCRVLRCVCFHGRHAAGDQQQEGLRPWLCTLSMCTAQQQRCPPHPPPLPPLSPHLGLPSQPCLPSKPCLPRPAPAERLLCHAVGLSQLRLYLLAQPPVVGAVHLEHGCGRERDKCPCLVAAARQA